MHTVLYICHYSFDFVAIRVIDILRASAVTGIHEAVIQLEAEAQPRLLTE